MIGLLYFVLAVLASPFKSKMRLEAENARGASASVDYFAAQAAWPCPTRKQRSLVLCPAISLVPVYPSGSYNHPSGSSPVVLGLRQGQQARAVQLIDVLDNIIAANE